MKNLLLKFLRFIFGVRSPSKEWLKAMKGDKNSKFITFKEAYEEAVGMSIDPIFFIIKNIDPYEKFDPMHDKLRLKPIVSHYGDWLVYHSYDFKFKCYVLKRDTYGLE